jgi:Asp-tRNA(Asn)/Glu-tRNA(Gln) amidotransferase A subunit family amidase
VLRWRLPRYFGRNPTDREHPSESVLHYGPLTRSVADAGLMQNVMSGQHPADIHSLRDSMPIPAEFDAIAGTRIALSMDLGYFEISDEVKENTRRAAAVFESLGATVDEVDLDWDYSVLDAWLTNWEGLFWALAGDQLPRWRFELDPFVVKLIERGATHSVKKFYDVNRVRYEMYQKLGKIFENYDLLICPTLAVPSVATRPVAAALGTEMFGAADPSAAPGIPDPRARPRPPRRVKHARYIVRPVLAPTTFGTTCGTKRGPTRQRRAPEAGGGPHLPLR